MTGQSPSPSESGMRREPAADTPKPRPVAETMEMPADSQTQPDVARPLRPQEIPYEFGRYRVQKLLGEGGMGNVYLAEDTQLGRRVALKIPRLNNAESNVPHQRFLREARAIATLTHPNVCPIYDVGEFQGTLFMAMAFIEGRPLADYINVKKPQAQRQAANVIRKVAMALADAHDKGIIHRDLKPANIMIDQRGEPIVMDFGLACRTDNEHETKLTQAGTIVGTPAYMAPEQISQKSGLGPAVDIYSLGIVLYELLTGTCPFEGTVISVIGQVLHHPPPAVETLRPDIDPALAAVCERALAKDPEHRFASMKEFATALATYLKGGDSQSATRTMEVGRATANFHEDPTVGDSQPPNQFIAPAAGKPLLANAAADGIQRSKSPTQQWLEKNWLAVAAGGTVAGSLLTALLVWVTWPPPPHRDLGQLATTALTAPEPTTDPVATTTEPEPAASDEVPDNEFALPLPAPPQRRGGPGDPFFFGPSLEARIPHGADELESLFTAADGNHDGLLDPEEIFLHIIRRVDANQDERASLEELMNEFRGRGGQIFDPPRPDEEPDEREPPDRRRPPPRGPGPRPRFDRPPPGNRPGDFFDGSPPVERLPGDKEPPPLPF